jgi:hypothetical protein
MINVGTFSESRIRKRFPNSVFGSVFRTPHSGTFSECRIRKTSPILIAAMLIGVAGCGGATEAPGDVVVARVDDESITLEAFEFYLATHMIDIGEPDLDSAQRDQVNSRMFDAFIEERLLLAEAVRRGVEVQPWEIETYLGFDEVEDAGGLEQPGGEEDRDHAEETAPKKTPSAREFDARERLMVQKLREEVMQRASEPTEEEVRAYAEEHRERLLPDRRLELRAVEFETEEDAQRIYREIRRRRLSFDEAVVRYETYPGQGRPQRVDWGTLSEEVREALTDLKPGRVSAPLRFHGKHCLFQVASWIGDPEQLEAELLERVRDELRGQRREQTMEDLLRTARQRIRVRLKPSKLPFRYVPIESPDNTE